MKVRLGDICTVVSGSTPKTNNPAFWDGDINWITPAELDDTTIIINESQRKITEEGVRSCGLTEMPAGTVILSSRAPIGKTAIAGVPMYCNQGFKNLICSDRIYNRYLYWFLRENTEYLQSLGRGATFKEISKKIVEEIEIPLPPLNLQKEIANSLDRINDLIALHTRQLTKLDELVKARFVEMFGDPITNPMGWEKVRFDTLCENLDSRRVPITSADRKSGIYPYYGASGIVDYVDDYIFDEDILLISEDGANLVMRSTPVAFSVSGKVWVNNHAHVVKFNEMATQKYIEVAFSIIDISEYITGSAQPKFNQAMLNSMLFCKPTIGLQRQFLTFISQVDKSKESVRRGLDKLETLKKALMQEYFG